MFSDAASCILVFNCKTTPNEAPTKNETETLVCVVAVISCWGELEKHQAGITQAAKQAQRSYYTFENKYQNPQPASDGMHKHLFPLLYQYKKPRRVFWMVCCEEQQQRVKEAKLWRKLHTHVLKHFTIHNQWSWYCHFIHLIISSHKHKRSLTDCLGKSWCVVHLAGSSGAPCLNHRV